MKRSDKGEWSGGASAADSLGIKNQLDSRRGHPQAISTRPAHRTPPARLGLLHGIDAEAAESARLTGVPRTEPPTTDDLHRRSHFSRELDGTRPVAAVEGSHASVVGTCSRVPVSNPAPSRRRATTALGSGRCDRRRPYRGREGTAHAGNSAIAKLVIDTPPSSPRRRCRYQQ